MESIISVMRSFRLRCVRWYQGYRNLLADVNREAFNVYRCDHASRRKGSELTEPRSRGNTIDSATTVTYPDRYCSPRRLAGTI
jgi:hypothetical protein